MHYNILLSEYLLQAQLDNDDRRYLKYYQVELQYYTTYSGMFINDRIINIATIESFKK